MCLKVEILLEQEKRNYSLLDFHWARLWGCKHLCKLLLLSCYRTR